MKANKKSTTGTGNEKSTLNQAKLESSAKKQDESEKLQQNESDEFVDEEDDDMQDEDSLYMRHDSEVSLPRGNNSITLYLVANFDTFVQSWCFIHFCYSAVLTFHIHGFTIICDLSKTNKHNFFKSDPNTFFVATVNALIMEKLPKDARISTSSKDMII